MECVDETQEKGTSSFLFGLFLSYMGESDVAILRFPKTVKLWESLSDLGLDACCSLTGVFIPFGISNEVLESLHLNLSAIL